MCTEIFVVASVIATLLHHILTKLRKESVILEVLGQGFPVIPSSCYYHGDIPPQNIVSLLRAHPVCLSVFLVNKVLAAVIVLAVHLLGWFAVLPLVLTSPFLVLLYSVMLKN